MTFAGSEVHAGERRVVAKKLRVGDQVLRSVDDKALAPFTVASVSRSSAETGYELVAATGTDGKRRLLWLTDTLMVAERGGRHAA